VQVALPPAEDGQVDGDHQGLVAGRGRRLDQRGGGAPVAEDVELEPERPVRHRLGQLGRADGGEGRQAHHRAGGAGRAGGGDFAVGMGEPVERGRGDQEGMGPLAAEQDRAQVADGHVDQHPGADLPAPPRRGVVRQRDLVAGPAGEVAVHLRRQGLHGEPFELADGDRQLHARESTRHGWVTL
jgi:hypothetical protein